MTHPQTKAEEDHETLIKADPAAVVPVLAHLVAEGRATEQQRAELLWALSPAYRAALHTKGETE